MMKKLAIYVVLTCLIVASFGNFDVAAVDAKAGYTTTADARYVPVAPPSTSNPPKLDEASTFAQKGYGVSKLIGGLDYITRSDLLEPGYKIRTINSKELLNFFTLSDVHVTDVQSPAQALKFNNQATGGYTPAFLYSAQELDAAVKSINKINTVKKLDFGLVLGDTINSGLQNELNMYLDVMTGRMVYPNTDMSKQSNTDYTQSFKAEGLNVPWYQIVGNHDHFWMGSFRANEKLKNALISDKLMKFGLGYNTKQLDGDAVYMGVIDVSDPYGRIIGDGAEFTPADVITANTSRKFMDTKLFSDTVPRGHGINDSSSQNPVGCYTFEPKSNVPVRVIVLDNTADENSKFLDAAKRGDPFVNGGFAFLDKSRFEWFSNQLANASKDGKLVIISAHIPLGVNLWGSTSEVSEKQVIAKIQEYSNVALVTAGHRHFNTVTAFESPNPKRPELGFWQVETASLRDFPQQYRTFSISINNDNTITIKTTNVDPENTSFASKSRSNAIAASQILPMSAVFSGMPVDPNIPSDPSGAYNAILLKEISPNMAAILRKVK